LPMSLSKLGKDRNPMTCLEDGPLPWGDSRS
jgi:hypothetical protein